jgi:hypothetical protein
MSDDVGCAAITQNKKAPDYREPICFIDENGSPPYFTIAAMRSGLPDPLWIFIGKAAM